MRFSHGVIIVLALQVRGCEAGLFDWISNAFKAVANFVTKAVDTAARAITRAAEVIKESFVRIWESFKNVAKRVWEEVKKFVRALLKEARDYGEDNWDCGADNFWPSKTIAKAIAEIDCAKMFTQINDACKRHDRCYSQKIETRTHCDYIFCTELDDIRYKFLKKHRYPRWTGPLTCPAPELYCAAVTYAGHTA